MTTNAKNTEVLIVGAGPAGLMMACQLAIHGIRFRIIDKKDHGANYSGALLIQARTIEILNQMGIARAALKRGIIAQEIKFFVHGNNPLNFLVKNIGSGVSAYPGLLLLEQTITEQLFMDFIRNYKSDVEWNTELIIIDHHIEGISASIVNNNGKADTIQCHYLIGADGSGSTVRNLLKIPFVAKTNQISLFIADCYLEPAFPPYQICFSFRGSISVGFFPLTGGRWRIDGEIPGKLQFKSDITFEDLEIDFSEAIGMNARISKPQWFSVFHSNQGNALSYQDRRCFLIGDAAHTISPVGAQGMNTGLQDAYNLAWKLAFVIQGKAKGSLLDTYSAERVGIAKNVMRFTEKVLKMVTSQHSFIKLFRLYVFPLFLRITLSLIEKHKSVRYFFFNKISETGIQYRKSSLSKDASAGLFPLHAPRPGDRFPYLYYVESGKTVFLQEKVKGMEFRLFLFSRNSFSHELIKLVENYEHLIIIVTIPGISQTKHIYKRLGIKQCGFYLIRPDLYIAYRSCIDNTLHFNHYLNKYLIRKE